MLHIIRSNAVESLLVHLARRFSAKPLASPFIPEVVVVPSPAMGRWVNLQLAPGPRYSGEYHLSPAGLLRVAAGPRVSG